MSYQWLTVIGTIDEVEDGVRAPSFYGRLPLVHALVRAHLAVTGWRERRLAFRAARENGSRTEVRARLRAVLAAKD